VEKLYGLIPAAGKGVRAIPYTNNIPKGMLDIDGMPNLQRIIHIMRDQMGITDIIIVVGHLGKVIENHFGDGSQLKVKITYVQNNHLDRGLAYSILLAKQYINDYFCTILSDECYINSNHSALKSFPYRDNLATCALMHVDDRELIRRNYSVETSGQYISKIVEKPHHIENDILGTGTFIFNPRIFDYLEKAYQKVDWKYVEFMTFVDELCRENQKISYFNLKGTYVNINDRDSLSLARYHNRDENFESNSICLLIYAEGDEKDIAFTIKRYQEIDAIDKIFVILPETSNIKKAVLDSGASLIICPTGIELYGEKLKYAMERTTADILVFAEADYSFLGRDIPKLLTYLREADMVVGTRTTRQLIEQGSSMRGVVRTANIFLAKFMELLWWKHECRFSDVGCTFRAIWRVSLNQLKDNLVSRGPEFSVEMMIEALKIRQRVIEIPVNYMNQSYSMYKRYQNIGTFFRFFLLIMKKRFMRSNSSSRKA
jgi:NDP-sugar pyrophosphorylase family protein